VEVMGLLSGEVLCSVELACEESWIVRKLRRELDDLLEGLEDSDLLLDGRLLKDFDRLPQTLPGETLTLQVVKASSWRKTVAPVRSTLPSLSRKLSDD